MKPLPISALPPAAAAPQMCATVDARWRLSRLLSAPHRLGFASAALCLALSALWWAVVLVLRQAGIPLPWAVPSSVAHGLLMSLSFMPLFIVGFLFTAGPRWLGLPDVSAGLLRGPVLLMLGGWALALVGFHLSSGLAAFGVAAVALGWAALMLRFVRLVRISPATDTLHATVVAGAGGLGVLALGLAGLGLGTAEFDLVRVATQLALWGFLAPSFVAVSHRMIPFFTVSALPALQAWRPDWLLWLMLLVLGLQGGFAVAELLSWPLPGVMRWTQVAYEAPAALLMLWLAWRWGLVQSLKIRLLAMLHAGFVWLGLSLALAAMSHALMAGSSDTQSLGLAPLHALTMGYLGATMMAMITRVASGHSGRPLAADGIAWALYWGVQAAVVLRVGAALWPAAQTPLTLMAISAWTVAALGWAWRYGGWLGRPRLDGRPG